MVCKCCAPNCKTGYASVQEEELERKLSIFKFPDGKKEPKKRAQWIAKIPRAYWNPEDDDDPRICELHFHDDDFIRQSTDSNKRRKRKKGNCDGNLKRKRLKKDAVPSIWPGSPAYLSKKASTRKITCSSSEARQKNAEKKTSSRKRKGKGYF